VRISCNGMYVVANVLPENDVKEVLAGLVGIAGEKS
jgi:hypothetical protein